MTGSDRVSYAGGFADLDDEVGPLPLPLQGDVPRLALGRAAAHRSRQVQRRQHHGEPLVRRPRHAAPVQLRRRSGDLHQPLPARRQLLRGGGQGLAGARRVRHRSVPHAVPARRRRLLPAPHRQLQRQCRRVRRPDGGADRDDAARALRRRDAADARPLCGERRGRRDGVDRASAPRRRARLPFQLRRRLRPQVALSAVRHSRRWLARARRRRDAGRQAGLHAFVRDDRALSRADRISARRRSAAADAGDRAVHPQLPLAARARAALSRVRQGQRRARGVQDDRRGVRLPPRQRLSRKAPTSSSTSSPTTTPASSTSSICRTCVPAKPSTPPAG